MESSPEGEKDPRIYMAVERTLLAWVRTGLALMGFGFVVARFGLFMREIALTHDLQSPAAHGLSIWAGTALVVLGVFVNVASAVSYAGTVRRLRSGTPWEPRVSILGLLTALLLAGIGVGMAVYLLASAR